ncbi:MAG: hypothetical protein HFG65_02850 [Hungatella sp.]|nr:hypothetical protein [Hungatella sp.]
MKNEFKRLVIVTLTLTCIFSGTVFARDVQKYNEAKNTYANSRLLPETEEMAYDITQGSPKSTAMGAAVSSIRNGGQGVIKILAETNMFKPVDWACLTVYLEQWDEENRSWKIVGEYEQEFLPEDEDDGQLTSVELDLSFPGHPMGYYYRARVLHELEFDGDWYEIRVTKTDGILMKYVP